MPENIAAACLRLAGMYETDHEITLAISRLPRTTYNF